MGYYCNECKKTISDEEFFYSMNRYNKALCRDHQRSNGTSGTTRDLQDLVRERHKDELVKETPVLRTVKDWIAADFETWKKVLKNKDEGELSYYGFRGRGEKQFFKTEQERRRHRRTKGKEEKGFYKRYQVSSVIVSIP